MGQKVVTGEVRLSYVNLFEPRSIVEGGPLKYGVSVLLPKDGDDAKRIKKVIDQMIKDEQATLKGTKGLTICLRDGDTEKENEEYADHYFINVSNKQKPIVVDENRDDIINPRDIYSGCYGRVSMTFFAYNKAGNKGIGVSLNAVQKTSDGEALGGGYTRASIDEDFGDDLLG